MSSFFEKLKGISENLNEEKELPVPSEPQETPIIEPATEETPKTKTKKIRKSAKKEEILDMANSIEDQDTPLVTPVAITEPKVNKLVSDKIKKEVISKNIPAKIKTSDKKWPELEGQLAVDVYQTEDELVIQSAIAGIKPGSLDITAQGDTVVIRGVRENSQNEEKSYFYQECFWGKFSREIILPAEADTARSEASMTDGILTIRIPKIDKDKKKKIVIQ